MDENGNNGTWGKLLTGQQRLFIDYYFETNCNGTRAAQLAGYCPNGSENDWASTGSRLLRNVKVQEEITRRWADKGMTAQEVVGRLADQGRGNVADYLTEYGAIDWARVKDAGHLVRKVTHRKGEQSSIELYDAQSALVQIGRAMGLFVDRQKHEGEVESHLTIQYVNDWRNNTPSLPAPGPTDNQESGPAAQLAERGQEMAQDNDGDEHRG